MFTGIVACVGSITEIHTAGVDLTLVVDPANLDVDRIRIGDSVAVNGVCLTVAAINDDACLCFDISSETVSRTLFKRMRVGSPVNLELALLASDRLGGHFVSGHVDGIGELERLEPVGRSTEMRFKTPAPLSHYLAEKGSITIDGVSLTVNRVDGRNFDVNIVPHTLAATVIGGYAVGQLVHLEVDLIARYVERLLKADYNDDDGRINTMFLAEQGFPPPQD